MVLGICYKQTAHAKWKSVHQTNGLFHYRFFHCNAKFWWQFTFTFIHILICWSLQNFAHATAAQLPWHVQKFVVIWFPGMELKLNEFSVWITRENSSVKWAPFLTPEHLFGVTCPAHTQAHTWQEQGLSLVQTGRGNPHCFEFVSVMFVGAFKNIEHFSMYKINLFHVF